MARVQKISSLGQGLGIFLGRGNPYLARQFGANGSAGSATASHIRRLFSSPFIPILLTGTGASVAALSYLGEAERETAALDFTDSSRKVPSRQDLVSRAKSGSQFDVLVIGGGATGAGIALDASSRGLSVCLVEQEDFGAGTSSRSTKLIHGGVRYLEKAVKQADLEQLKLVFEALQERKTMIDMAPHLSRALPIFTPCYKWWEVPYFWAGMKMYDLIAGTQALTWSRFVSAGEARRVFPTLAPTHTNGDSLQGVIVYYDGQFDDARYNVSLACSAALAGAVTLNHTRVTALLTEQPQGVAKPRVSGASVEDRLTGERYQVRAQVVVNAAGPFSDAVRKMGDPSTSSLVKPSSGVHIVLPDYYSPENCGLIVPKTKDGRVVFLLPWLDHTVAGTTDSPCEVTMEPRATEEEVDFILDTLRDFLKLEVRRSDVLSAWSGIRPLAVAQPGKQASAGPGATEAIVRDHVAGFEENGLLTVTGGKWTTHRLMAQDAVDLLLRAPASPLSGEAGRAGPCVTKQVKLVGARGWTPELFTEVAQHYVVPHRPGAIDTRVAKHLASAYGDRAFEVTRLAEELGLGKRLVRGHPVLEAEVVYACRHELCESASDFIARRCRLAFVDTRAAAEALPRVVELMAKERGWSKKRADEELANSKRYLLTFGGPDWVQEQKSFRERKAVM